MYHQVFMTGDGKGWGLRTLDEIPKGTFICEYSGEILTAKEYQERYGQSKESLLKSQPVLLDADWALRSGLKDEEAFCLDAAFYGNIARFINHR
jgi:SET domain-containing protein